MSTRNRIINSATVLFWRHGYNAVSVDAICEAAECPKGSFYHAFSSKEELLVAVIRQRWDSDRGEILSCYAVGQDLAAQFQRHLEWFGMNQRRILAKIGFAPGSFNMSLESGIPSTAVDIIRASRDDHYKILINTISKLTGLDSESIRAKWLTMVVVRFITATLMEARLENSLDPFNTLPESVFSLVGLAPQPPWA
jgi:TetR/AcrR family transcriptional repressor of nem operon